MGDKKGKTVLSPAALPGGDDVARAGDLPRHCDAGQPGPDHCRPLAGLVLLIPLTLPPLLRLFLLLLLLLLPLLTFLTSISTRSAVFLQLFLLL